MCPRLKTTVMALLEAPERLEPDEPPAPLDLLAEEYGHETVLEAILDALRDDSRAGEWQGAAAALWGCVCDRWPVPRDETIALLVHRLQLDRPDEDDLVWSIASKLAGVGYLSSWRPLEDAGVRAIRQWRMVHGE